MNFAPRMARLGTESAFEVLARARQASSAPDARSSTSRSASPTSTRRRTSTEAAKQALDAGATHYGPAAGCRSCARRSPKHVGETRGIAVSPEEVVVTPGAKPIMFFTIMALIGDGDEVIHPNPGFPIYESVINFVGGVPVPIPLRRRDAASVRSGPVRAAHLAEDEADRDQLARESHRRRPRSEPARAHRRDRGASGKSWSSPTRSTRQFLYEGEFASITQSPGHAGAHDPPRRLLEAVRDDRLASRLRRDAAAARRARRAG